MISIRSAIQSGSASSVFHTSSFDDVMPGVRTDDQTAVGIQKYKAGFVDMNVHTVRRDREVQGRNIQRAVRNIRARACQWQGYPDSSTARTSRSFRTIPKVPSHGRLGRAPKAAPCTKWEHRTTS